MGRSGDVYPFTYCFHFWPPPPPKKKKKKNRGRVISCSEFKDWRANSVDLAEVAHYEPPHQDLCCLQIQLFQSLVLTVLKK